MADTLLELAARCEGAEGREQFGLILNAWFATNGDEAYGRSLEGTAFQTWWNGRQRIYQLLEAGAYLDAAMSLVPEGCRFSVSSLVGPRGATAFVSGAENRVAAATPALALCAAAIKARAAISHQEQKP